jgi:hypothetical protein
MMMISLLKSKTTIEARSWRQFEVPLDIYIYALKEKDTGVYDILINILSVSSFLVLYFDICTPGGNVVG